MAVFKHCGHTGTTNVGLYVEEIILLKFGLDFGRCLVFLKGQFWIAMEMLIQSFVAGKIRPELINYLTDSRRHF